MKAILDLFIALFVIFGNRLHKKPPPAPEQPCKITVTFPDDGQPIVQVSGVPLGVRVRTRVV